MTFLNGFVASFAALASVPIIIHLMNRRRFRVETWAAMEFLMATLEKNARRLQLRDLIIMMLRALAIALLAISLARLTIAPGHLGPIGSTGETASVIVLDHSMSMGYSMGPKTRFEAAKEKAATVIESLPDNSTAALLLLSDAAKEMVPEPSHDRGFVNSEVQRAKLTDAGTNIFAGLTRSWEILQKAKATALEIYLISDMQDHAWPETSLPPWKKLQEEMQQERRTVRLFLIQSAHKGGQNLSVEDVRTEDDIVTSDSSIAVLATLRNNSDDQGGPAENVTVDLYIGSGPDGEMRKAGSQVLESIESVQPVRFETTISEGGDHRIEIRTSIDRLEADNHGYFVADVVDRMQVLLIDGQPGESDKSFTGETDFLQAALAPIDFESDDQKTLIECDVATIYDLGGRNLRDYRAVVLANVGDLNTGLVESLESYVRSDGGGLLIFLGDNINPRKYNDLLFTKAGLLPGKLGRMPIEAEDDETGHPTGFGIATDDLSHPVVSYFKDRETQPFLASPRFMRAWPIELPKTNGAGESDKPLVQVVARYADGHPAIIERRIGRGKVILFASTADKDWNDTPLRPAFLPVVRRATQYVALGQRTRKNIRVNERIVELVPLKEAGTKVRFSDPKGTVREVSPITGEKESLARIEVSHTDKAGFYQLTRTGESPRTSTFAANPPRNESGLNALTEDDLRGLYPNLDFQWIGFDDDLRHRISQKRVGRELWPLLLLLAFLCLLSESYLAMRWAPRD